MSIDKTVSVMVVSWNICVQACILRQPETLYIVIATTRAVCNFLYWLLLKKKSAIFAKNIIKYLKLSINLL